MRIKVIAAAAVVGLVAAGGAFAFWTAGGTGSGQAGTGDTVPLVIHQSSVVSGLTPGGPSQALSGTFDNPNTSVIRVPGLTATVASVVPATCGVGNFVVGGTAVFTQDVAAGPGTGQGTWSGLNIALRESGVNQDVCKNATVNLTYALTAPVGAPATLSAGVLTVNYTNTNPAVTSMSMYLTTTGGALVGSGFLIPSTPGPIAYSATVAGVVAGTNYIVKINDTTGGFATLLASFPVTAS